VAVDSFFETRAAVARIPAVIQEVLVASRGAPPDSVEAILDLDDGARRQARSVLTKKNMGFLTTIRLSWWRSVC